MPREVKAIALTGRVLDWNEFDSEEHVIAERQRESYEEQGFMVVKIAGDVIATREIAPDDGDVMIQAKLDAGGRMAVAGGHSNLGYSGYFTGYVYVGGRRRRLIDFRELFPAGENQYSAQYQKTAAEQAVKTRFSELAGAALTKVAGGYSLFPADSGER